VLHQPGEQDAFGTDAVSPGEFPNQGARRFIGGVLRGIAAEAAAGQRAPGLQLDAALLAMLHRAGPGQRARAGAGLAVVEAGGRVQRLQVTQAQLQLVDHQRLRQRVAQPGHLAGIHVGHAEVGDLARIAQQPEGLGDLVGLHQRIGAMQQQDVQALGPQPFQAGLDRLDDVAAGQVVALGAVGIGETDAALALQHDALAQRGLTLEQRAEDRFGLAEGVDVGVIEQGDADVQRGLDARLGVVDVGLGPGALIPAAAQAHAAVGEAAGHREVLLQRKGGAHGAHRGDLRCVGNGHRAREGAMRWRRLRRARGAGL